MKCLLWARFVGIMADKEAYVLERSCNGEIETIKWTDTPANYGRSDSGGTVACR